ncbi:MAG: hypothetical protein IPN42_13800 [Methylococcaceae bacterium]|nr:hypothetical protein [Methylococcaceae bacterium]
MTIAICKSCGKEKWGAFNECDNCGFIPNTEDELAESLILSDHYFDKVTLSNISLAFQTGKPPKIDEHSKNKVKSKLHQFLKDNPIVKSKKKTRLFNRLFGYEENAMSNVSPALSLNKKIYLVADNVLTPITLSTDKMSLTLDEEESTTFYLMLLMAKSSEWSGGRGLVEVRLGEDNQPFVFNLKIDSYAYIDSDKALELANLFSRLMDSGISNDDGFSTDDIFLENRDFTNRVIAVMGSGDVEIKIG